MLRLLFTLSAICVMAFNGIAQTDTTPPSSTLEPLLWPRDTIGFHEVLIQVDPSLIEIDSGSKVHTVVLYLGQARRDSSLKLNIVAWEESKNQWSRLYPVEGSAEPPIRIIDSNLLALLNQFPVIKIVISLYNYRRYGALKLSICLPPDQSITFEKQCKSVTFIKSVLNQGDTIPIIDD